MNKQEMHKFFGVIIPMHGISKNSNNLEIDSCYSCNMFILTTTKICLSILTPGKEVVIDELMIPWRQRLGMRQYFKNKRYKYGVKLYRLCMLEGYIINVKVYCSKEEAQNDPQDPHTIRALDEEDFLLGHTKSKLGKTFKILHQAPRRLKKYQLDGKGIKIIKWQDKRPILMISNKKIMTSACEIPGTKIELRTQFLSQNVQLTVIKLKSDKCLLTTPALRKKLKWY
nr:unnamed protein product [Callosobruchus analis]